MRMMRKRIIIGLGIATALSLTACSKSPEQALANRWPLLEQYCTECHNDAEAAGNMAAAGRAGVIRAQQAGSALVATELRDGLQLISGSGGNVVARVHDGALLLVDSGAAADAPALRKLFGERFGTSAVDVLFNTHWHLDSSGGNEDLLGERALDPAFERRVLLRRIVANHVEHDVRVRVLDRVPAV